MPRRWRAFLIGRGRLERGAAELEAGDLEVLGLGDEHGAVVVEGGEGMGEVEEVVADGGHGALIDGATDEGGEIPRGAGGGPTRRWW
jgi:hypothetical protein